jgi:hypothetical protein
LLLLDRLAGVKLGGLQVSAVFVVGCRHLGLLEVQVAVEVDRVVVHAEGEELAGSVMVDDLGRLVDRVLRGLGATCLLELLAAAGGGLLLVLVFQNVGSLLLLASVELLECCLLTLV